MQRKNKYDLLNVGTEEEAPEINEKEQNAEPVHQKNEIKKPKSESQKQKNNEEVENLMNTKKTRNAYSLPLLLHLAIKRYTEAENIRKQSENIKGRTTQDDSVEEAILYFMSRTQKGKAALEKAKRDLMP